MNSSAQFSFECSYLLTHFSSLHPQLRYQKCLVARPPSQRAGSSSSPSSDSVTRRVTTSVKRSVQSLIDTLKPKKQPSELPQQWPSLLTALHSTPAWMPLSQSPQKHLISTRLCKRWCTYCISTMTADEGNRLTVLKKNRTRSVDVWWKVRVHITVQAMIFKQCFVQVKTSPGSGYLCLMDYMEFHLVENITFLLLDCLWSNSLVQYFPFISVLVWTWWGATVAFKDKKRQLSSCSH